MKINIPIYIDYKCEYNDHVYEINGTRFSPEQNDMDFYHDDIIKPQLVNYLKIHGKDIINENITRSYNIIIDLTEEQVFYLSLKYDSFLEFYEYQNEEIKNG